MNPIQPIKKDITQPTQTAIEALSEVCDLSRAELKQSFTKGAVWVTSGTQKPTRVRRVKRALKLGDRIELHYNPKVLNEVARTPILMLDNVKYSIWLKPRGMLSQGSKWGDHTALYRWVEMNYQADNESQSRQAWLVHRLDRATCGLQLLAHSKKMAQILTKLFENRQIEKRYKAIVHGQFPSSVESIESTEHSQTYQTNIDGRSAITHVKRLKFDAAQNLSLVDVKIETGRKHQIRIHLSQNGFPILGDRLYGDETLDNQDNRPRPNMQLTAYQLEFTCPINQTPIKITLDDAQLDLTDLSATDLSSTEPKRAV